MSHSGELQEASVQFDKMVFLWVDGPDDQPLHDISTLAMLGVNDGAMFFLLVQGDDSQNLIKVVPLRPRFHENAQSYIQTMYSVVRCSLISNMNDCQ